MNHLEDWIFDTGKTLKKVRYAARISLTQLGLSCDSDMSTIALIENGHRLPDLSLLRKLILKLGQVNIPEESYPAGRPATRIETEAMTALIKWQDRDKEAREVVSALLATARLDLKEQWPKLYERAQAFLERPEPKIIADGDEPC